MRDYGKIFCAFWSSADTQSLSDQGKILAAYLLTSQHTTLIGCFRAPFGYIEEDLKWSRETVSSAFIELSRNGFATVDEPTGWVLVHKYLQWNPIENPNQGKQAERLYEQIPRSMPLIPALARILANCSRFLSDEFLKGLETVPEPSLNQEQEQEQEQDKKIPSADAPVKPKREPKVRVLGGYPEELNLAMGIWRDLRRELLAEEILALFPNDPDAKWVAQVGTKGAAWEAWQKRRGMVTPNGVKVTDEHIQAAVRLWAETRYKLAKAGKNLSMPNLSTLINSADFEDALLRVAAPEVAHAV